MTEENKNDEVLTQLLEQNKAMMQQITSMNNKYAELETKLSKPVEPEKKPEEETDLSKVVSELDFDDQSSKGKLLQIIEQVAKQAVEGSVNPTLEQLNKQIYGTQQDIFMREAGHILGAKTPDVMKTKAFDDYFSKSKNPATGVTLKEEFENAAKTNNFMVMRNLIDTFSQTDEAKEAYKEVTGEEYPPASLTSNSSPSGDYGEEVPEGVKEIEDEARAIFEKLGMKDKINNN